MAYNSTVGLSLSHGKHNNYALNGKIMLCSVIILFLVVVLIACFHSYARWWFHRRSRVHRFFSPPNQTILPAITNGSISGNQGLDLSLLKSLPTFVYPATHQSLLDCAVCLSEFESGKRGRLLPKCNHVFHVECIDMWFKSHSNCPLCRAPVEKSDIQTIQTAHLVDFQWRNRSSFETVVVVSEPADGETGSSEVSQLEELVPAWCGRMPEELVGITVEIPVGEKSWRGLEEMGRESGSVRNEEYKSPGNGVLSLKRIWSA